MILLWWIITGKETWIYEYDPETKRQSSLWKFPTLLQTDPTVFTQLSAREISRLAAEQIVTASPRQCTCSQCLEHSAVPQHRYSGSNSLFIWSCSMWRFSFPQAQGDHQGDPVWRRGSYWEVHNNGVEGYPRRILQKCIEASQRRMWKGFTLKRKIYSFLLRIEINFVTTVLLLLKHNSFIYIYIYIYIYIRNVTKKSFSAQKKW